jgi:hypothetical protein
VLPFALYLSSGIRRDDPLGLDADHGCKFVAFSAPQLMIYPRPIDPGISHGHQTTMPPKGAL